MNPDTGAIYASVDEGVAQGEKRDDLVFVEGRQDKIDSLIRKMHEIDKDRSEKKRQLEKNRRNAAQASRKKNRRKK